MANVKATQNNQNNIRTQYVELTHGYVKGLNISTWIDFDGNTKYLLSCTFIKRIYRVKLIIKFTSSNDVILLLYLCHCKFIKLGFSHYTEKLDFHITLHYEFSYCITSCFTLHTLRVSILLYGSTKFLKTLRKNFSLPPLFSSFYPLTKQFFSFPSIKNCAYKKIYANVKYVSNK